MVFLNHNFKTIIMKKILYVLIGLLLLYLILALFAKSEMRVERKITVNKSQDLVRSKLADLNFYHQWDPFGAQDPAMTVNFSGTPGEPGHSMNWNSNVKEVGQGTLEVVAVKPDSVINKLSMNGMSTMAYYVLAPMNGGTEVTWGIYMKFPFLMRPMTLFMDMDKMVGDKFAAGLENFKKQIEAISEAPAAANYEIKEMEWPETNYVGTKKEMMTTDKLQEFFGKNYPALFTELEKEKMKPESAPSAIFYSYDETKGQTEVAAVVKMGKGVKLKGYESHTFPAGKVLHIAYYGGYSKMAEPHQAMDKYMKEKGLTHSVVVEEYASDPGTEKDSTKWLTNIYYLLK
jgi:effector-binding domain-containing protein